MEHDTLIRRLDPEDEDRAIEMLIEKRPPAQREAARRKRNETWPWQYNRNPNNPDGRPFIVAAKVGGDLAGMIAAVPVQLRTPSGVVSASWGLDLIVDPRYRGRGLARGIVAEWVRHFDVSLGLDFNPGSLAVAQAVGFEVLRGFTRIKLVLSRWPFIRLSLGAGQYRELRQLARHGPGSAPCSTSLTAHFDDHHRVAEGQCRTVDSRRRCLRLLRRAGRSVSALALRFTPDASLSLHPAARRRRSRGLAIVRLTDADPPLGIISDLIVPPGNAGLVLRLMDETIDFLASSGAYAAVADLPPALARVVTTTDRRFLTQPLGMLAYARNQPLRDAGVMDASAWLISRSDSDQDY